MGRKASPFTRVTTVLGWIDSAWYEYWLKGLAKVTNNPVAEAGRISTESAEFGTGVHKLVEAYLRKEMPKEIFMPRQIECAGHIIQWLKEVNAEPLMIQGKPAIEFEVKSLGLGLIGHFDAVVQVNGVPWIVDWKTSSKMRRSFPLQKSAYAMMLEEEYGIHVDDGATIRVDRDPAAESQFEVKEYHNLHSKYWPVFQEALNVYNFFNKKGKWKES